MLSAANKSIVLTVVMLSVAMLNVVAPEKQPNANKPLKYNKVWPPFVLRPDRREATAKYAGPKSQPLTSS